MLVAWFNLHTNSCGRVVGSTGDIAAWAMLAAVVSFLAGAVLSAEGAGWAAIAAVAATDLGLMPLFLGTHQPDQAAILVLLGAHGGCTAIAAWWSRQIRAGTKPARAKAGETGRILIGGWLALLLLTVATSGGPVTRLLPDSTFINLFVIVAIGTLTGTGYTKYVEAKADTGRPEPDRLDDLAGVLLGMPTWLRGWNNAYRTWW
jgi:hypothetical protein